MSPEVPGMFTTKCTNTKPFVENWGSKVNESRPASPCVYTRLEMSRNGVGSKVPPCTTRIRPGSSAMKRRESPGGACKSIGLERPAVITGCNRIAKGGKSTLLVLFPHAAGSSSPRLRASQRHILMGKLLGSTQSFQMRHHAPPERGERVASLENRHDPSFRIFICNFLDALRDPGVVGFGETQAGHVVLDVCIEAR